MVILIGREYAVRGRLQVAPVRDSALRLQADALGAQAEGLGRRLHALGHSASGIAGMAELVLRSPQAFGSSQGYTAPVAKAAPSAGGATEAGPAAGQAPAPVSSPPAAVSGQAAPNPTGKAPVDNPMVYTQGKGGAIRKVFDDGGCAVFYRARAAGAGFSAYERQRLFATGALEPLIKQAVRADSLAAQAYLLTSDGLLRTYPYRDFSALEGSRDLNKLPIYAWSKDKAGPDGVVWTSPYPSLISGQWVVCALASVTAGERQIAVAGVEVSLAELAREGLAFSLGSESAPWLQRTDGTVLAVPAGGEETLGVTSLSAAPLPSEVMAAQKLLDQANLTLSGREEISRTLSSLDLSVPASSALGDAAHGRIVYCAPVGVSDWVLAAQVTNSLIASTYEYERKLGVATQRRVLIMAGILLVSLLFASLLAGVEAGRITRPLRVMRMQVDSAAGGSRASLLIPDDSEIGELAEALQALVDACAARHAGGAQDPLPGPLFDEAPPPPGPPESA